MGAAFCGMLADLSVCLSVKKTGRNREKGAWKSEASSVLRMGRNGLLGEAGKQKGCSREGVCRWGDPLTCPFVILGTTCLPQGLRRGRLHLSQPCSLLSWAPQIQPTWGFLRAWPLSLSPSVWMLSPTSCTVP